MDFSGPSPDRIPFRVLGPMDSMNSWGPEVLDGFRSGLGIHYGAHCIFLMLLSLERMGVFVLQAGWQLGGNNITPAIAQILKNQLTLRTSPGMV